MDLAAVAEVRVIVVALGDVAAVAVKRLHTPAHARDELGEAAAANRGMGLATANNGADIDGTTAGVARSASATTVGSEARRHATGSARFEIRDKRTPNRSAVARHALVTKARLLDHRGEIGIRKIHFVLKLIVGRNFEQGFVLLYALRGAKSFAQFRIRKIAP